MAIKCCCKTASDDMDNWDNLPPNGIAKKRCPTDIPCLVLFIVFWIGMIGIAVIGFVFGNPQQMIEPSDYNGWMCGKGKASSNPVDVWNENGADLTAYPYLFFPINFSLTIGVEELIKIKDLGICVATCPLGLKLDWDEITDVNTILNGGFIDDSVVCDYAYKNSSSVEKAQWAFSNLQGNGEGKCYVSLFTTTPVLKRCLPDLQRNPQISSFTANALNTALFSANLAETFLKEILAGWMSIVISVVICIFLCFAWVILIFFLIKIIAAVTIFAVFCILAAAGGYLLWIGYNRYQEATILEDETVKKYSYIYLGVGGGLIAADVVYVGLIIFLLKRIVIATELIKEASKALFRMPLMLLYPPLVFSAVLVLTLYIAVVSTFIQSAHLPIDYNTAGLESLIGTVSSTTGGTVNVSSMVALPANSTFTLTNQRSILEALHLVNVFGFFWGMAFIIGVGYTAVAGAIAYWYFSVPSDVGSKKKTEKLYFIMPMIRVIVYHLGSIAFGALLVAIVQFLKIIVQKLRQKFKNIKGAKWIAKAVQAILTVLELIIKYINKNAYIMIAIHGKSFCFSATRAFTLLLENILQVGAVNTFGIIVLWIGKILIIGLSAGACFGMIHGAQHALVATYFQSWFNAGLEYPFIPTLVVAIIAFLITTVFMNVYSTTIDTVLLCFCEDQRENNGDDRPYYCPKSLRRLIKKQSLSTTSIRRHAPAQREGRGGKKR